MGTIFKVAEEDGQECIRGHHSLHGSRFEMHYQINYAISILLFDNYSWLG